MLTKPLNIENLSLEFPHKICFEGFSTQINYGDRIGIIGRNGCGKSSIIKILLNQLEPSAGRVTGISQDRVGYVPQTTSGVLCASGGEYFWNSLSKELFSKPDILILDEPTNHLDLKNREKLVKLLNNYSGILIISTHDRQVLDQCIDTLWHLDEGDIKIFHGLYRDYTRERELQYDAQNRILNEWNKEKKKLDLLHKKKLKRNNKSKKKESRDNNKMGFGNIVNRAQSNSERNLGNLNEKIRDLNDNLKKNKLPERIIPRFFINSGHSSSPCLLSVTSGWCGYSPENPVLSNISLSLERGDKVGLLGNNGSGKTTLFKTLLRNREVFYGGDWRIPGISDVGYLDQHYSTLNPNDTVEESIYRIRKGISQQDVRSHLNRFLFKKNAEISTRVSSLSGGEKARLSLACIAMNAPGLLLLDEVSNNVDMETKEHIADVLANYPGTMIVISHEADFLDQLNLTAKYETREGTLVHRNM